MLKREKNKPHFSLLNAKNEIDKIFRNQLFLLSNRTPSLSQRVTQKMKNYKISSFNFILDEVKNDTIKVIEEISINGEDKKNQELSTSETDKYDKYIEIERNEFNDTYDYIGKKRMIEIGTQTEEMDNNKKINISKMKIMKLIDKYSYKYVFNLLLKNCGNSVNNELENNSNKDANQQMVKLIKNFGIQNVMSNIILIGNSRGEQIDFNNKKEYELEKEKKVINLDEELENKKIITNNGKIENNNFNGQIQLINNMKNKLFELLNSLNLKQKREFVNFYDNKNK